MSRPTAIVLHPEVVGEINNRPGSAQLAEACNLAESIRVSVVHSEIIVITKLRAASFFGKGLVERLKTLIQRLAESTDWPIVIVNGQLSPIQQRNLENDLHSKVIDRTQLILEIFGERAKTHAGRLQVELAALSFQRGRLVRSWTHLERQRGGGGFLGGPGERQIELDRRMLLKRVVRIRSELREVLRTRTLHRGNRTRGGVPTVVLVGYTNAGKSTLFNRLTGADVLSKDMLFATLDPTVRKLNLDSGRGVLFTDTVGFISKLPTELIEAFKSTLEEVLYADILVHVHDASSPLLLQESEDVSRVLRDIGLDESSYKNRTINILNKIDKVKLNPRLSENLRDTFPNAVLVSALKDKGISDLKIKIDQYLNKTELLALITLAPHFGAARAWLFENGVVEMSRFDDYGYEYIEVRISRTNHSRFCARWPNVRITFKTSEF